MPYERSAGAVIFYRKAKTIEYLILQYRHEGWDFPRGAIEKGEEEKQTARREIREETGLKNLEFILGFRKKVSWFYRSKNNKTIYKEAIYFLARSRDKKVELSSEHTNFQWLPFQKALEQLTFDNAKKILQKAHEHLTL